MCNSSMTARFRVSCCSINPNTVPSVPSALAAGGSRVHHKDSCQGWTERGHEEQVPPRLQVPGFTFFFSDKVNVKVESYFYHRHFIYPTAFFFSFSFTSTGLKYLYIVDFVERLVAVVFVEMPCSHAVNSLISQ